MSELAEINNRIDALERNDKEQSDKLDRAVKLLEGIHLAFSGDAGLGIQGIVQVASQAHRRIDSVERHGAERERAANERMDKIEANAAREKWVGRIGSGVVGACITGAGLWLKEKLGLGG